jgi:hypothetical protein
MSEIRIRTRLSAIERRTAVVETACRVFAKSSTVFFDPSTDLAAGSGPGPGASELPS